MYLRSSECTVRRFVVSNARNSRQRDRERERKRQTDRHDTCVGNWEESVTSEVDRNEI